jgi:hypothetical protein
MSKSLPSAANKSGTMAGGTVARGCVVAAAMLLGKPPRPVRIFATNFSFACAKGGASGMVAFCSIAALSGFWFLGRTTMLSVSLAPS